MQTPNICKKNSTIFKTFDNGTIDRWTAQIGVLGKSFNELGSTIDNAFKIAINNIDNFEENIGFWESLKNNLFPQKKDLQSLMIEIPDLIDQTNIFDITEKIKVMSKSVSIGETTWQELFNVLPEGEKHFATLGQQMEGQIITTEGVIAANKAARDSALQHNAALKAQTLGAKTASIGMKALAMAGNMLIFFAVTKGIELVAKAIDNYVHRLENAKEKLTDITADIESVKNQLKETQDRIRELEELEKNGTLSITDKEDLENLRLQNEELGIRQKYLEEQQKIANRDVENTL